MKERHPISLGGWIARFCLLIAVGVFLTSAAGWSAEEKDLAAAEARLVDSREQVDRRIARLPRKLQETVGLALKTTLAPLRYVGHGVSRTLAKGFHESIETNLNNASDVLDAIAVELDAISAARVEALDATAEARMAALQAMAAEAVEDLRGTLDEAIEHAKDALFVAEEHAGEVAQAVIDRSLVEAIGYIAAAIFLVGLLFAGLQILSWLESGTRWSELGRGRLALAWLAVCMVLATLVTSLAIAIRPELLATRSARTALPYAPDPCLEYARQMERAEDAASAGSEQLLLVARERLEEAREACFVVD